MATKPIRCNINHDPPFMLFQPFLAFFYMISLMVMPARFAFGQVEPTLAQQKAKQQAPQQAPQQPRATIPSDSSTSRTVIHKDAYKQRKDIGPHLSFKITPPEKRGKKGMVLVEVYNYSTTYLSVVDFWLVLNNNWGDKIEVHVTCDDIKPNWSAVKWVKIEGNKEFPQITRVEVRNMVMFNEKAVKVNLKYVTDLIKS